MMWFLFFAVAGVIAATGVVVIPLFWRRPVPRAGDEDIAVLADNVRELDADLARGLLSRDEYDQARDELHRDVLALHKARSRATASAPSWAAALAVVVVLPLAAVALYGLTGQPAALLGGHADMVASDANAPIHVTIKALANRLKNDESDGEGWLLLARSQYAAGQTAEAVSSYARTVSITPDDPDLLIEYANVLGQQNSRDLRGQPTQLIQRALQIDPENFNALALAGAAAMQIGDRRLAVKHWTRLQSLMPADAPDRSKVDELLAQAQGRPAPLVPPDAIRTVSATVAQNISGTVVIDPALADKVSPSDTLFIFARVPGGPPMPLAAVRKPAAGWPVRFTLDDSTAMIEGMALSASDYVDLLARVSRTGNAAPQPGDVEGRVDRVAMGAQNIELVLDRIVAAD